MIRHSMAQQRLWSFLFDLSTYQRRQMLKKLTDNDKYQTSLLVWVKFVVFGVGFNYFHYNFLGLNPVLITIGR